MALISLSNSKLIVRLPVSPSGYRANTYTSTQKGFPFHIVSPAFSSLYHLVINSDETLVMQSHSSLGISKIPDDNVNEGGEYYLHSIHMPLELPMMWDILEENSRELLYDLNQQVQFKQEIIAIVVVESATCLNQTPKFYALTRYAKPLSLYGGLIGYYLMLAEMQKKQISRQNLFCCGESFSIRSVKKQKGTLRYPVFHGRYKTEEMFFDILGKLTTSSSVIQAKELFIALFNRYSDFKKRLEETLTTLTDEQRRYCWCSVKEDGVHGGLGEFKQYRLVDAFTGIEVLIEFPHKLPITQVISWLWADKYAVMTLDKKTTTVTLHCTELSRYLAKLQARQPLTATKVVPYAERFPETTKLFIDLDSYLLRFVKTLEVKFKVDMTLYFNRASIMEEVKQYSQSLLP